MASYAVMQCRNHVRLTSLCNVLLTLPSQVLSSRLAVSLTCIPCASSPKTSYIGPNGIQNLENILRDKELPATSSCVIRQICRIKFWAPWNISTRAVRNAVAWKSQATSCIRRVLEQ
ncbi:hypothetical protein DE146DRAFT_251743 [Phaeosphaeria sp. MPI-PUGE-AT-0046c]|nr:hypothetical protein DE146DRAFT_251743 [Phaeosphaeria sp. MPI-PUGE-AT-0046c]